MIIQYSKQAQKFLHNQDKKIALRIIGAINKLPAGDVKRMQGKNFILYRLRVGTYRIKFTKTDTIISIEEIDNRGDVYK